MTAVGGSADNRWLDWGWGTECCFEMKYFGKDELVYTYTVHKLLLQLLKHAVPGKQVSLVHTLRELDSKDKATYPVMCLILGISIPPNREEPPSVFTDIPTSLSFIFSSWPSWYEVFLTLLSIQHAERHLEYSNCCPIFSAIAAYRLVRTCLA
jgi:hypothetical protein